MNKYLRTLIGIIALILILIGASGCNNQKTTELQDNLVQKEFNSSNYINYSDSEFNKLKGSQPFVLFFHADWCGTCKILDEEIKKNIDQIPSGVKILKTSFDNETALKKEYGILLQSMFVLFDEDGNVVEKLAAPLFDELVLSINDLI